MRLICCVAALTLAVTAPLRGHPFQPFPDPADGFIVHPLPLPADDVFDPGELPKDADGWWDGRGDYVPVCCWCYESPDDDWEVLVTPEDPWFDDEPWLPWLPPLPTTPEQLPEPTPEQREASNLPTQDNPEPSTLMLAALGATGLGLARRHRASRR